MRVWAAASHTLRHLANRGGDAGLGYFAAEQLAATGAHIIIASRHQRRADAALASNQRPVPSAWHESLPLDLGALTSARAPVIAGPV